MAFIASLLNSPFLQRATAEPSPSILPPTLAPASNPAPTVTDPTFGVGAAAYGQFIPLFMGYARVPCQPLWIRESAVFVDGSSAPKVTWAAIAGYPIVPDQTRQLFEVHANGNKIVDTASGLNVHNVTFRFYPGSTTQDADPAHVADKGSLAPAYRRRAHIVFDDFPTEAYGGQLPAITLTIKDTISTSRTLLTDALAAYASFKGHLGALICEGLDGISIDGLIVFDQDLPLKDFLAVHGPLFGFDFFERGADIVCARRVVGTTYTVTKTLAEADLLPLDQDGALQTSYSAEVDLPDVCELGYYALEVNFQRSHAYARTRNVNNPNKLQIDCCLIITPSEGQSYAWRALWRTHVEATRRKIKLPPKHSNIEPGDILSVPYRGTTYLLKAMAATIAQDSSVDVECCNVQTDESATFTGYAGTIPSAAAVVPVNVAVPTITGTAQVGYTLTATLGTWQSVTAPTYAIEWRYADTNVAISGATGRQYVVRSADSGHTLKVVVTPSTAAGTATPAESVATATVS